MPTVATGQVQYGAGTVHRISRKATQRKSAFQVAEDRRLKHIDAEQGRTGLRQSIKGSGLTITDYARRCGLTLSVLCNYLNGYSKTLSPQTISKIVRVNPDAAPALLIGQPVIRLSGDVTRATVADAAAGSLAYAQQLAAVAPGPAVMLPAGRESAIERQGVLIRMVVKGDVQASRYLNTQEHTAVGVPLTPDLVRLGPYGVWVSDSSAMPVYRPESTLVCVPPRRGAGAMNDLWPGRRVVVTEGVSQKLDGHCRVRVAEVVEQPEGKPAGLMLRGVGRKRDFLVAIPATYNGEPWVTGGKMVSVAGFVVMACQPEPMF